MSIAGSLVEIEKLLLFSYLLDFLWFLR